MSNRETPFNPDQVERAIELELAIAQIMRDGYCTSAAATQASAAVLPTWATLAPDTDACRCYDDELGEPVC